MTTRAYLSTWKNPAAEQRFRTLEDELVEELVAEPPIALDVETRLGPTRVYHWPGAGEPIVFLHGATGTSLMWAQYAERRRGRTMYAIDTIGDVGRSRQQVAVEDAADLADWLEETLAAIGIDRVHVTGTSYGAFLALNLAVRKPSRVRSLFLIEPAGIVPVRLVRFMLWGAPALFAAWLPGPLRRGAARTLRMPALENSRVMRLVVRGQLHHRARFLPPGPLTDDELRTVLQPARFVLGQKSAPFPARHVAARAVALLPDVDVEIVPNAGHAVALSHLDHVGDRLDDFLRLRGAHGAERP
jgi:pimeloyl-ACP methyl ester carboxylesterase